MPLTFEIEKPNSRRVPDSARRRAQVSCDRCKLRRIRCVRPSQTDTCEACHNSNQPCKSTIPRKPRLSNSFDSSTEFRYKALDALVKGLFPNEDCDDVQTLFRLGARSNIPMPGAEPFDDGLQYTEDGHRAVDGGQPGTTAAQYPSGTSAQNYFETASTTSQTPLSSVLADLQPWPYNVDLAVQGAVTNIQEETCIPAPHGVAHYVGPASSFEFANAVRRLVTMRSELLQDSRERKDRRSRLRAEFADLKTSIALEPRIEAHPASTVREQTASESIPEPPSSSAVQDSPESMYHAQSAFRPSIFALASLRAHMPPKRLAEKLIKAFFDRLHSSYPLFHRGTFHTQYDLIWQRVPLHKQELDPGWICSLLMVFVFGAQLLEHEGLEDASRIQRRYLRLVRENFHNLALSASLPNVQALLLLQAYEHNAGERNTSWILLGQAARMAIALGMHREGTSHNFEAIERNTRKMVWFTLYSFEQYASLALGRPSTIKALEANVKVPDEAMLDGNDHPPDYFIHSSGLLDLTSKVRHFATASSPHCFDSQFLTSMISSMDLLTKELRVWSRRLPRHLQHDWSFSRPQHLRAVLLLHINYHYIISVLTRPYLLCKVHHDIRSQAQFTSPSPASPLSPLTTEVLNYANLSITSSLTISSLLHRLATASLLEGTAWLDFFYLYHAMLVLCLDFLGRPHTSPDDWTARDREVSAGVSFLIEMRQSNHLAPTYRILSKVAIQFAHIVGLAGDLGGVSRAESERVAAALVPQGEEDAGGGVDAGAAGGQPQQQPPTTDAQDGVHATNLDQSSQQQHHHHQGQDSLAAAAVPVAPRQPDVFMPFVEPLSDISQFNDDNVFWDFFNVAGLDPLEDSLDPVAAQLMGVGGGGVGGAQWGNTSHHYLHHQGGSAGSGGFAGGGGGAAGGGGGHGYVHGFAHGYGPFGHGSGWYS